MANNDSGGSFIIGFLVGGIVGAAVGVLLAPRAGTETRADLAGRSEVWRTTAEELAATLRKRVGPTVEDLRERVGPAIETMKERVGPAVETVRERVGPVVEQVTERVGRAQQAPSTDGDHEAEPAESEAGGEAEEEA